MRLDAEQTPRYNTLMRTYTTRTSEETRSLATTLGALLGPGDVILLCGELGAGKTTFVQGLAEGLGVRMEVTSPTFTLLQEYAGARLPLFHFDAYRIERPAEIADLGFDEYLERGGVVVVEWAERLGWLTPEEYLWVNIVLCPDGNRKIILEPFGSRYEALLRQWEAETC
ncbi:MAG TPA: tRNA (adenosine(37)-N6)-threonylcarbamoyltransferase complex ATPase subunit type 1 TsaE [Chthonomonadales bacterium]|nr:tRNA (adenosine(37)-N6)-threonylcarbamoyltransferase complex ATPase subunit type 1 TsaE [Chthonomonadales bacterium]